MCRSSAAINIKLMKAESLYSAALEIVPLNGSFIYSCLWHKLETLSDAEFHYYRSHIVYIKSAAVVILPPFLGQIGDLNLIQQISCSNLFLKLHLILYLPINISSTDRCLIHQTHTWKPSFFRSTAICNQLKINCSI